MLGALVLVFLVMRVLPGDPAIALLGTAATPDAVAALRRDLGVDRPLPRAVRRVSLAGGAARLRRSRWPSARPSRAFCWTPCPTRSSSRSAGPWSRRRSACRSAPSRRSAGARGSTTRPASGRSSASRCRSSCGASSCCWCSASTGGCSRRPERARRRARCCARSSCPPIATGFFLAGVVSRITRASILQMLGQDFARTARAKGLGRVRGRRPPRAPERDHPGPHGHRPERRDAPLRRGRGRDGLHAARASDGWRSTRSWPATIR